MSKSKQGVNSLYLTAAQLIITATEEDKEIVNLQLNEWTLENLVDEAKLFSPTSWVASVEAIDIDDVDGHEAGKLLGVPVRVNYSLKDTDIVIVTKGKKPTIDNPIVVVLK